MRYWIAIITMILTPIFNIGGVERDMTVLPEVLVVSKHHQLLHMLASGISKYRARRNLKRQWNEFRKERNEYNEGRVLR